MKILFITPYITTDRHPAFLRNRTGFGMMVYDIAKYVGKTESVSLFAVNAFAPVLDLENFRTIKQSWFTVLTGLRLRSFVDSLKFLCKYKLPFKESIRIIYQYISVGSLSLKLQDLDMVHIHGCSPITDAAIRLCRRQHIPFAITLHGLVSFENAVRLHPSLKKYEKDFLMEAYKNNYAVSFISTGNYEQALNFVQSASEI